MQVAAAADLSMESDMRGLLRAVGKVQGVTYAFASVKVAAAAAAADVTGLRLLRMQGVVVESHREGPGRHLQQWQQTQVGPQSALGDVKGFREWLLRAIGKVQGVTCVQGQRGSSSHTSWVAMRFAGRRWKGTAGGC
jgi:hypothetical protein